MPFSTTPEEEYLRKRRNRIAAFSGCFGSNAKWRRIFETLSAHADQVGTCFVKDIWEAPLRELKIPKILKTLFVIDQTSAKVRQQSYEIFKLLINYIYSTKLEVIEEIGLWFAFRSASANRL